MRGILLAGGRGSRLYPAAAPICKQLLPVYDKPMVYYPLSTLMLAGIRDILLITSPEDAPRFVQLLGDGAQLGISIRYAEQPRPEGVAQALVIGRDFAREEPVALILGDNVFFGHGWRAVLERAATVHSGAVIFGYRVTDPGRYGVAEIDGEGRVVALSEKPQAPQSNCAVTGLYFYDGEAARIASALQPSARGELEITDVNREYLRRGSLRIELLGRGMAWLDTGTPDALLDASHFVQVVERRQGLKISCIEEVAYRMRFIDASQLERLAASAGDSDYGAYLRRVLSEP